MWGGIGGSPSWLDEGGGCGGQLLPWPWPPAAHRIPPAPRAAPFPAPRVRLHHRACATRRTAQPPRPHCEANTSTAASLVTSLVHTKPPNQQPSTYPPSTLPLLPASHRVPPTSFRSQSPHSPGPAWALGRPNSRTLAPRAWAGCKVIAIERGLKLLSGWVLLKQ